LVAPVYVAVNACVPTVKVRLVEAVPPLRASVASAVVPSKIVTFPVGAPAPGGTAATVTERTVACPVTVGLIVDVRLVVVRICVTCCTRGAAELPTKLAVAVYVAEIDVEPIARLDVVQLAVAAVRATFVHNAFPPDLNVTVPVGVSTLGAAETVAVKVMPCPFTAGFTEEVSAVVVVAFAIATTTPDEVAGLYPPPPEYRAVTV